MELENPVKMDDWSVSRCLSFPSCSVNRSSSHACASSRRHPWRSERPVSEPKYERSFSLPENVMSHLLVGGFNPSEKYEFVSWDDYSQDMESHNPFMFQTTNQFGFIWFHGKTTPTNISHVSESSPPSLLNADQPGPAQFTAGRITITGDLGKTEKRRPSHESTWRPPYLWTRWVCLKMLG